MGLVYLPTWMVDVNAKSREIQITVGILLVEEMDRKWDIVQESFLGCQVWGVKLQYIFNQGVEIEWCLRCFHTF